MIRYSVAPLIFGLSMMFIPITAEPVARGCFTKYHTNVICRAAIRTWAMIEGKEHVTQELYAIGLAE